MAQALKYNFSLRELSYDQDLIPFSLQEEISSSLERNKTLSAEQKRVLEAFSRLNRHFPTTIDLRGQQVAPENVGVLLPFLEHHPTLTELNLGENDLGLKGAQVLAQLLTSNNTLSKLYLKGSNLGP